MYNIKFTLKAEKQLNKLDKDTISRIFVAIDRLRIRPYAHLKKLVGTPYYRARAGEYRIIVDIRNDVLLIIVISIGHRSTIYKDKSL